MQELLKIIRNSNKENRKETLKIVMLKFLSPEKIANLLLDKNIKEDTKLSICNYLDNYSKEETREKVGELFIKNNEINNDLLYDKYLPNCIKESIVCELYDLKKDMIKILNSEEESFELKKIIIDSVYNNSYYDLFDLLNKSNSKEVLDYILNEKTSNEEIVSNIKASYSDELKEKIILKQVNENNILKLLNSLRIYDKEVDLIVKLKKNELLKSIKTDKSEYIFDLLQKDSIPKYLTDEIIDKNYNKIKRMCFFKSAYINESMFYDVKNKKLTDLMYKTHKIRLFLYLTLGGIDSIEWLISDDVDNRVKKFIKIVRRVRIKLNLMTCSANNVYYLLSKKKNNIEYKELIEGLLVSKRNKLIKRLKDKDVNDVIYELKSIKNNDYTMLIINNYINKENIIDFLNCSNDDNISNLIINKKNSLILELLENISDNDIFRLRIEKLSSDIRNLIVRNNISYFKKRISKINKDILLDKLSSDKTLKSIKLLIIENFGYDSEDAELIRKLIDVVDKDIILNNYTKMKELLDKTNIDVEVFTKYGVGSIKYSNWLDNMLYIIKEDKIDSFISIKNYLFSNYYNETDKENEVYTIRNFQEILANYLESEELFNSILKNRTSLDSEDISDLDYYFKTKHSEKVREYSELKGYRKRIYEVTKEKIVSGLTYSELRRIFNDLLFDVSENVLKDIGGVSALKMLQLSNKNSKTITALSNEIILYSRVNTLVNNTGNRDNLEKALLDIFSSYENFTEVQNIFLNIDKKIKRLYELDSKINLTSLEGLSTREDLLDKEYMMEYGGITYDFSDKNYVLYAHILSSRETMHNLMNGISTSKTNFMSLSAISYKGQKYYYDSNEMILAFDKIPTGSFICSSTKNMGTNYSIKTFSTEVEERKLSKTQRGILETSAVTERNSEALLYREGLIPAGIILPGRRKPTSLEIEYHNKYNLPFIITQKIKETIENPKKIFDIVDDYNIETDEKSLKKLIDMLQPLLYIKKDNGIYTGREIAIITDIHGLYEPTIEVLEDIKKNGIKEIYSLGDNIGSGPNPSEIIDLLDTYSVNSVLGNSEYYMTLGTAPFSYLNTDRIENEEWTYDILGNSRIDRLKYYLPSYDLVLGDKKIALCHFINDVRWNFNPGYSTFDYQKIKEQGKIPTQFNYTNSDSAKKVIEEYCEDYRKENMGYISAKEKPILNGKPISEYNDVMQGHVHFENTDVLDTTNIYTLDALAIGHKSGKNKEAYYYVLKERKDNGFDIEKRSVPYNYGYLVTNIKSSDLPHKEKILSFLR